MSKAYCLCSTQTLLYYFIKLKIYSNNMSNKLVLKKEYSIRIVFISQFMLFSALVALCMKNYDSYLVTILIYCTSMLYWINPIHNSWQQYLDRFVVRCAIVYHFSKYKHTNYIYFCITSFIAIIFYIMATKIENQHYSSICHVLMHVLGNIANVLLYI